MKKAILILISFVIMVSVVGCSAKISGELKQDMTEIFEVIDDKNNHFTNGDYDNWILDNDTLNYIMTRFVKYSFHYQADSEEKLSENEVYILEGTKVLFNIYAEMQGEYSKQGDGIIKNASFKQRNKELNKSLKTIKSKLK